MTEIGRPENATLPERMRKLPVDARGYVVPWFVQWVKDNEPVDGPQEGASPEFRAMDRRRFVRALREQRCWVCGEPLGRWLAFVIGPMCAVTRTTSEPPCHLECAQWSAEHCPFLSNPDAVRRTEGLPDDHGAAPGIPVLRNPGATCVWVTREYEKFQDGQGRWLLTVGKPERIEWWCRSRAATRAEVQESIDTGMATLIAVAKTDGPLAVEQLEKQLRMLDKWLPTEVTV